MKTSQYFYTLISILLLTSCDIKQYNEKKVVEPISWNSFIVETRFQEIEIENSSDTIHFKNKIFKDGVGDIPPKYELDRIETGTILLTKEQKDSLIFHIENTISKPSYTNVFATDYVGNVAFILKKNNMKLICEYYSVGDWTTVSEDTRRIYEILNKHVEMSTQ